jgi:hypothetical protein
MILTKSRDDGTRGWAVYHRSVSVSGNYTLILNSYLGQQGPDDLFTGVSSTTFTLGNDPWTNWSTTQNMIAYCFTPVSGHSAMGSYSGASVSSGSGPFVWTGFRPAFIWVKKYDGGDGGVMWDTARAPFNPALTQIRPNEPSAESAEYAGFAFDILSNGFRPVGGSGQVNEHGKNFVYYAVAEHPFKNSRAR